MPSPIPKDPKTRQRRNKAVSHAVLTTEEPKRKRAPQLPRGMEWHKLTRAWWRDVWRSPMADEYLEADIHGLYILAELVDRYWNSPSQTLAAEIRLQRQCFGLTPIDRRRLQWEVERVEATQTRRQQRNVRRAQAGEIDPREALRAVK